MYITQVERWKSQTQSICKQIVNSSRAQLFKNWKRGSSHNIFSHKIQQIHSWTSVYIANRPQTTSNYFWFQKKDFQHIQPTRRIRSVFDKLIPSKKSHIPAILVHRRKFNKYDKVFYKNYKNNTTTWEPVIIKERIGNMIYTVQRKKFIHRRHVNQPQKRKIYEPTETPQIKEDDLQDLYDTCDPQMPQAEQEARVKRKQKAPPQFIIDPKRKNTKNSQRKAGQEYLKKNNLGWGVLGITYLFSIMSCSICQLWQ